MCFFNKSALLVNANFYYLNYLGLNKGEVNLSYTYFIVILISGNCRNIKTIKYNGDSATLRIQLCYYQYMKIKNMTIII